MTLADTKNGQVIEITSLPNTEVRAQAMRLGLYEGARFACRSIARHGPVVLTNGYTELAVGFRIAAQITVRPTAES